MEGHRFRLSPSFPPSWNHWPEAAESHDETGNGRRFEKRQTDAPRLRLYFLTV
jgi:hypothetical protein